LFYTGIDVFPKRREGKIPQLSIIIFCIISLIIILIGYYFYKYREGQNEADIYSHLSYISKLKAEEITSWRNERLIDANDIQKSQSLINDINEWFLNKNNIIVKSRIQNWIKYLSSNINYANIYLLNPNLKVELSANTNLNMDASERKYLLRNLYSKKIQFTDLHRSPRNNSINLDLIIPLLYSGKERGKIIGLVLITIDPAKVLFPLVKTWPLESRSAETLLIRPDGDSVLFLNDLRGKQNTALNFRLPLTRTNVPAVHATLGYRGIFEGQDYRGVRVLSDITSIPGTNWVMITKMDLDEILAPLQKTILLIISYGAIIILIAGSVLVFKWKNQQSNFYQEKYTLEKESENALKLSENKFRYLAESITDIFFAMDSDLKITYWNPASEKMSGIQAKDATGKIIYDVFPNVKGNKTEKVYLEVLKTKLPKTFVNEFQKDGMTYAFEVSVYSTPEGLSVFTKDITESKNAERTIRASLKEKEVLLRELYHRTKNNMQVISSLIGLKSASIEDEQMKSILHEMRNRIQTIALVHQKLYQSQNLSRVDLKEYITDLVNLIANSYAAEQGKVTFILNLANVNVLIDTAVPCGLIINELISNSFKHAFPEDRKGNIFVQLKKLEEDTIELVISDNGVGIPEGFNLFEKNTLGMQVFYNIATEQLMGNVEVDSKHGLTFIIQFKDVSYEERV
jgi:PAS domain S-box-containing protein